MLEKFTKYKHSGTAMALILPVALWVVQATVGAVPNPPEWVYAALAISGAGALNHFTGVSKDSK